MKRGTAGLVGRAMVAGLLSTALAAPLLAQSDEERPRSGVLLTSDIVVTAQRREERLVDVPIAVSAVSSAALDRAAVQSINDTQAMIPNLQVNQTVGNGFSPLFSIRGLAPSADTSLARDQPIGLYVDGVPISKSTGAAFDMVDLERLEVLRGPQGTLYGKNTIGGAINLITQKPTGELGGQVYLSYGSWNELRRRFSVNLPEFANIKIKLGYSGRDAHGYWHNRKTGKDFGEESLHAGRVDVLWEPSDKFSARYVYDISDSVGTPTMLAIYSAGPPYDTFVQGNIFPERPGRNDVAADNARKSDFRTTGHALTLEYDLGAGVLGDVVLKSITARRTMKSRSSSDFDGTAPDLLRFSLNNDYKAFSQELQVIGTGKDIRYTLGFFYWKDDYDVFNPRWNFQMGGDNYDLSDRGGGSRSLAGYGTVTWSPSALDHKLDVTAGIRWTRDKKKARELFLANSAYLANPSASGSGVFERLPDGTPVTQSGGPPEGARPGAGGAGPYDLNPIRRSDSWSRVNPEFNIVYKVWPTWSFYGRFATGFKSGGINDTAATNLAFNTPYDPEKLTSFELGTKFSTPDHRFNLNVAVYHSIYKNFQAGVFVPDLVTTNIINAGEAKFTGVEVEGSIQPFDNFSLNFGGGYLDARYTDFVLPDGTDVTDHYTIPLAPKWNYQVGGVYTAPVGDMNLEFSANWSWRSSQWATIDRNVRSTRKAYGTLNSRIALTDIPLGGNNSLELAAWGKNLTDTKYWNSGIDLVIWATRQWANPRSVGVEARVRF